jgi:hypothetical protein
MSRYLSRTAVPRAELAALIQSYARDEQHLGAHGTFRVRRVYLEAEDTAGDLWGVAAEYEPIAWRATGTIVGAGFIIVG